MNKVGHVSFGVAMGTVGLYVMPAPLHAWEVVAVIGGAALASLLPDLDHKTSTASNWIQLPHAYRKMAKGASLPLLVGALLAWWMGEPVAMVLAGAGALAFGLSRLRSVILLVLGMTLLFVFAQLHTHWLLAVIGGALVVMPALKHRGMIHSPEFALLLSAGLHLFTREQEPLLQAAALGVVIGWWAHLIGDAFGKEGISLLIWPKAKLALRMVENGGRVEWLVAKTCSAVSVVLIVHYFV
jgi:hypothetical protein